MDFVDLVYSPVALKCLNCVPAIWDTQIRFQQQRSALILKEKVWTGAADPGQTVWNKYIWVQLSGDMRRENGPKQTREETNKFNSSSFSCQKQQRKKEEEKSIARGKDARPAWTQRSSTQEGPTRTRVWGIWVRRQVHFYLLVYFLSKSPAIPVK